MMMLVVLLTFISVYMLFLSILIRIFGKEKPIDKLQYYEEGYIVVPEKSNVLKKDKVSVIKAIANMIPTGNVNKERRRRKELELIRADLPITVEELLVIKVLSSSSLAFFSYAVTRDIAVCIGVLGLVWFFPRIIISSKKKTRKAQFNEQLNEGIILIANALKAGYSFLQALAIAAEETTDPFAKEFKKALKEMNLGISMDVALANLLDRTNSQDMRLIVNAILIQKDIGGNLSEILENISQTIRERQKIQNELRTLTAQGKMSGMIVMLMPIFLGGIIYLFNKSYIMALFQTQLGLMMLGGAVFNQFIGFFFIKKITSIEM